jgi:hypothetical protein
VIDEVADVGGAADAVVAIAVLRASRERAAPLPDVAVIAAASARNDEQRHDRAEPTPKP